MIIPLFIGFYTSQVVQDFVHQQYVNWSKISLGHFPRHEIAARLKAVVQVEFAKVVVWRNYEGAVQGVMQQVRMQVGELKYVGNLPLVSFPLHPTFFLKGQLNFCVVIFMWL